MKKTLVAAKIGFVLFLLSFALGFAQAGAHAAEQSKSHLVFLPVVTKSERHVKIIVCDSCDWWNPWSQWNLKSDMVSCDDTTKPAELVWIHDDTSASIFIYSPTTFDEPFVFNQDSNNQDCWWTTSFREKPGDSFADDVRAGKVYFNF